MVTAINFYYQSAIRTQEINYELTYYILIEELMSQTIPSYMVP